MNKTIQGAALIVAVAIVVSAWLLARVHRYTMVNLPGAGGIFAYEIDGATGQTWLVSSEEKRLIQMGSTSHDGAELPLPDAETSKIVLRDPPASGYGDLYNGSSWIVTKAVITATTLDGNGNPASSRDYAVLLLDGQGQSLTVGSFPWNPLQESGSPRHTYTLKQAFGIPPKN